MNAIDPTTPITCTLQAQEWNSVVAALTQGPYHLVAPLIQKLGEQMQRGAAGIGEQMQRGAVGQAPMHWNGGDRPRMPVPDGLD